MYYIHQLVAMSFLGHTINGTILVVDHIDNDRANNHVSNLQIVTNRVNSTKDIKGGSSDYIGVCYDKHNNKWKASIRIYGKLYTIGSFINEIDAAVAYKETRENFEKNNELPVKKRAIQKHEGAYLIKGRNKWKSCIYLDGKNKHLGVFNTREEAAQAYSFAFKEKHNKTK